MLIAMKDTLPMVDENTVDVVGLGASLDDIEDLPSFATFPTGSYVINLVNGIERKEINEKIAAEVSMVLKDIVELDPNNLDKDEAPPKIGDIGSVAYMLANKFGVGRYKEDWLAPLSKVLNTKVLGEIEAGSKGLDLLIVIKRITSKKDADKQYMQIKKLGTL